MWQAFWLQIIAHPQPMYVSPTGNIGETFISMLADKFEGVQLRKWNSEWDLLFTPLILQKHHGIYLAQDTQPHVECRLKLWSKGSFAGLVTNNLEDCLSQLGPEDSTTDHEASA